jgi:hypothetical protein
MVAEEPACLPTVGKAADSKSQQNATLLCHNCIFTNPPESEIKVSFTLSNTSIEKVLDLSYDSNNKMISAFCSLFFCLFVFLCNKKSALFAFFFTF